MNQTLDYILARRSVRNYTDQPVDEAELRSIVQAGESAAHGMRMKARRFTVITSPAVLRRVSEVVRDVLRGMEVQEGMPPFMKAMIKRSADDDAEYLYGAPAFIVVSTDEADPTGVEDASTALTTMMIAAVSLGLGACWLQQLVMFGDLPHVQAFFREIGIPEDQKVRGALAVGHPGPQGERAASRPNETHYLT